MLEPIPTNLSTKRDRKPAFVSSAGTAFQVFKALSDAISLLGGDDEDLRQLISSRDLARQVAELLVTRFTGATYPVTVSYGLNLGAMVETGRYVFDNPDITEEHFPVGAGKMNVETVLLHLDRYAFDGDVLSEMNRLRLRPATMAELLAFGSKYPEIQREFPVLAFGSIWADYLGRRFVGCLTADRGIRRDRSLSLVELGGSWQESCRFLAART